MNKKSIFFALLVFLFLARNAYSANLAGDLIIYDQTGFPIITNVPITGIVDLDNDVLIIDDFMFFGLIAETHVLEILPPGSYTRVHNGVTVEATIDPGHVGAYMIIAWGIEEIPMFMGWEVTSSNTVFDPVDVDGDGIPGMMMLSGPFFGLSAVYEFTAEPTGPGVRLVLSVEGGNLQECASFEGTEVTINAIPQLFGGATLESISWTVDGEDAGTGILINQTLSLGEHVVEAVATTTTGETGTASITVTIRDTTRPGLQISFIDNHGQVVDVAGPGPVKISMTATDICDPEPVISNGTATPTSGVADGDVLHINASNSNLKLPTTRLRVDATATDASGNSASASAVLSLE